MIDLALTPRQLGMLCDAYDPLTLEYAKDYPSYPEFFSDLNTLMGFGFVTFDPNLLFGYTITQQGIEWLELADIYIFDAMFGGSPDDWKMFPDDSDEDDDDYSGAVVVGVWS